MQVKTEHRTKFSDEMRLIPKWAWVLAGIGIVGAQVGFDIAMASDPKAPPLWARVLIATAAGAALGCYVLLIGYINRDAGRRGMSRLAWTLLAIFVPNGLGIILYFILRQALPSLCQKCGAHVQAGYTYCPHCGDSLAPRCPYCQHAVHGGDVFCPFCGKRLDTAREGSITPLQTGA